MGTWAKGEAGVGRGGGGGEERERGERGKRYTERERERMEKDRERDVVQVLGWSKGSMCVVCACSGGCSGEPHLLASCCIVFGSLLVVTFFNLF